MHNASGKMPGRHSFICLFNEHLVNTFFSSLGYSEDKKDCATALMKLNLNKRRSQSTKKQIYKKSIYISKVYEENL